MEIVTKIAPIILALIMLGLGLGLKLEDFIIENWSNTEFGEKYDLIYEDGELIS